MYPAGRFAEDGPFSGARFREEVLAPKLNNMSPGESLEVTLDGVAGAGSGFIEEAFGGLVRGGFTKDFLAKHLVVSAKDETLIEIAEDARQCIEDASATAGATVDHPEPIEQGIHHD